jgi:hypothetical protein
VGLTTQQIMNEAKLLVPPSADITDEQMILKLNQIQRKLYRELPLPDKIERFTSTKGIPFYTLPPDCPEDRIKNVLVDGQNYSKSSNQGEVQSTPFFTVAMNKLYLYPNPDNAVNIYLYYRPRYRDLSLNKPTEYPELPEDYHELLVFGLAQWVASILRDIDMVNNMQSEYDALLRDAKGQFKQLTPKRVAIKEVW